MGTTTIVMPNSNMALIRHSDEGIQHQFTMRILLLQRHNIHISVHTACHQNDPSTATFYSQGHRLSTQPQSGVHCTEAR